MTATKLILTDDEDYYHCDCGFTGAISTDCDCETCLKYQKNGLPLQNCPNCGQPSVEE